MKIIIFIITISISLSLQAQDLTAEQLLDKIIAYHDPDGNWEQFAGKFKIVLEMPDKPDRVSTVTIDLLQDYFNLSTIQDGKTSFREIKNKACRFSQEDGSVVETTVDDTQCERGVLFKNYYTYLYGLPMKLKDAGTYLDPVVERKEFKGKEYLVLKVTYDKTVGTDIWQFYFNPETYAMQIYQFFKSEDETTGEYILLTGEALVNGIKMPKDRAWYYNKDDGYLGTDKLVVE